MKRHTVLCIDDHPPIATCPGCTDTLTRIGMLQQFSDFTLNGAVYELFKLTPGYTLEECKTLMQHGHGEASPH
ncbi:MAG: hypothetical protein JWN71_4183 [Xanthobacteraceae bacterium]|nr:hypothetical protein [Xanthobacteraceae bacterium]